MAHFARRRWWFVLTLLFCTPLLAAPCEHSRIQLCILELAAADQQQTLSSRPWPVSNALFAHYHQALLKVKPQQAKNAKHEIIALTVTLPPSDQQDLYAQVAMIEFFAGSGENAIASIKHALALSDENSSLILLQHFMQENQIAMNQVIHLAGFSPTSCDDKKQSKWRSLQVLDDENTLRLNQQIDSLPDIRQRLLSWFLLARYMDSLNPCLLLSRFYDYQIILTLRSLQPKPQRAMWARWTKSLYRNFELLHRKS